MHFVHEANYPKAGTPYTEEAHESPVDSPEACSFHGLRFRGGCSCFMDWEGSTCASRKDWAKEGCLGGRCANCSHGVCLHRSEATATARPYVYVYPLPPAFNELRPRVAMPIQGRLDRNTPYEFWRRLELSPHHTCVLHRVNILLALRCALLLTDALTSTALMPPRRTTSFSPSRRWAPSVMASSHWRCATWLSGGRTSTQARGGITL